ncbi:hypothetical protein D3C83_01490 [compost metagenome]
MDDFDGGAVEGGDHLVLLVGARAQMVLGDREPAVEIDRQPRFGGGEQDAERNRRTVHVFVHAVHVAGGFQIVPAGIEADAFADQRQRFFRLPMAIAQVHDCRVFLGAALCHGDKRPCLHPAQPLEIVLLARPAVIARELCDALAIGAGRQFVGRQHGKFAA